MECRIFEEWFATKFCPTVKTYLASQGLPQKALLLVDNAACHAVASSDNNVVVKFLPANITSILQPMVDFIKKVTIKDWIYLIAEAWDKTPQSTLFKAWNKVYLDRPSPNGSSDERTLVELPIPEELNAVVAEWETSGINNPGYEQLSDEDIIQHVRGSESPDKEEEKEEDDNKEQWISHFDTS